MFERQQSDQQKAREVMKDGGVVIYWRPGCPYCEALDSKLGELDSEHSRRWRRGLRWLALR